MLHYCYYVYYAMFNAGAHIKLYLLYVCTTASWYNYDKCGSLGCHEAPNGRRQQITADQFHSSSTLLLSILNVWEYKHDVSRTLLIILIAAVNIAFHARCMWTQFWPQQNIAYPFQCSRTLFSMHVSSISSQETTCLLSRRMLHVFKHTHIHR